MTNVTNTCKATRIKGDYNDIFIVNAARVSFDKESEFDSNGMLKDGDQRLLNYLASHAHWTPFSHVRETFAFDVDTFEMDWFIQATTQENLASIVMAKGDIDGQSCWLIKHSLFGWINLLNADTTEFIFQPEVRDFIITKLSEIYPGSMKAYKIHTTNAISESTLVKHVRDITEKNGDSYIVELYDENRRDYFVDITIREDVPIYVARQRFKHMIGFTFNEVSRRYVSNAPTFFVPDELRGRAENKKQGSTDDQCKNHDVAMELHNSFLEVADALYAEFTDIKGEFDMCPEQARGTLPQAMITSYYATGNLAAWKRLIKQRLDDHAQKEIRDFAIIVDDILEIFNSEKN